MLSFAGQGISRSLPPLMLRRNTSPRQIMTVYPKQGLAREERAPMRLQRVHVDFALERRTHASGSRRPARDWTTSERGTWRRSRLHPQARRGDHLPTVIALWDLPAQSHCECAASSIRSHNKNRFNEPRLPRTPSTTSLKRWREKP